MRFLQDVFFSNFLVILNYALQETIEKIEKRRNVLKNTNVSFKHFSSKKKI